MANGDFEVGDWTLDEERAYEIALDYVAHCRKCGFRPDMVLAGLAWDADHVIHNAYQAGIKDERDRIRTILGV